LNYLNETNKAEIELTFEDKFLDVEMEEDIYNLTFLMFLKTNDAKVHSALMLKCILTFFMQVGLTYLVRYDSSGFESAHLGDLPLNAARIICGMILHISIVPEIRCSISLLKFA